ncbi:MAG: aminoacyl-tRNA hydrolase [Pseudomonadota bacterium]
MAQLLPDRLIVGLGNPGAAYALTRHSIGFRAVDAIGAGCRIEMDTHRDGAAFGIGRICGHSVALIKPMTYMNRSGVPTGSLLTQWGLTCREMIVIHDDMDLTFGRIKIKTKGGDGGHRGIRSLVDACGDDRFCRIRVGIGRSASDADAVDHVLGGFDEHETAALGGIIDTVRDAAIAVLCEGAEVAMNRYNRRSSDNS